MSKELLKEKKDQFLFFVETGFIAVNQSDEDSAKKLFEAAHLLNKESPLPDIGLGYMHLCKLELKEAMLKFNGILEKDPTNDMAKSMLGLAMSLTPDLVAEGEKLLTDVARKSDNEDVKKVADSTLSFVDEHVKKPGSIMDVETAKKKKDK